MEDYFTICQYKTEEPRNIEISAPVSLGFVLVWNKRVFPRSNITVFQTYNKKYGIKNVVIWVEILEFDRYAIAVITLSENKNENFQSIEKPRESNYTCSFSFTQDILLVLVPEYDGVCEELKDLFANYT